MSTAFPPDDPLDARPPVCLRGVAKRFGDRVALHQIDLEVQSGTAVGLVGPNGSGKTTLMRLLVGLTPPTEGKVELFGAPPHKRALDRVGYMTQAEAIYVDLTPRENVRFFGYLLTAMTFLRERTGGTLERIFATPLRPLELTLGYFGGFLSLAVVQAAVVLAFMLWVIGVENRGDWLSLVALLFFTAIAAEGLGIFLSTLARTEFQVVQFVPLIILPQVFLCGLFWPVDTLPAGLLHAAYCLPLTYAIQSIRDIMLRGDALRALPFTAVVAGFAVASVCLAALTMRRRLF